MIQPLTTLYTNQLLFIALSVVAAVIYRSVRGSWSQGFLLLFSLTFYTLCCGWYVLALITAGVWSQYAACQIEAQPQHRRRWLALGIIPVVATLCVFKFTTPLSALFIDENIPCLSHFILPLGMSYYVLKAVSYLCDVYHRRYRVSDSYVSYLSYITFFGQIVAGPIQRFDEWRQSSATAQPWRTDFAAAYYQLVRGMFLKLVIASRLSPFIVATLAAPIAVNGLQLWLFFFLYAVYIYADFAGYSLIAIGITRLFGFHCPDNFRLPYFSSDIREFWSRWHITLSQWLRDYIYIPLGGSRCSHWRHVLNVMITFLVSGLWHGSTLSFMVWGAYHGLLNVLTPRKRRSRWIRAIGMIATFLLVALGWLLFCTPDVMTAVSMLAVMMSHTSLSMAALQSAILPFTGDNMCLPHFLTVVFFILMLWAKECNERFRLLRSTPGRSFVWQVFVLCSLLLFGLFGNVSFIYAGF